MKINKSNNAEACNTISIVINILQFEDRSHCLVRTILRACLQFSDPTKPNMFFSLFILPLVTETATSDNQKRYRQVSLNKDAS